MRDDTAVLKTVGKLANQVDRQQKALDQAVFDRDEIIRWALDNGVSTRKLATAARVSQPRIVQIRQSR